MTDSRGLRTIKLIVTALSGRSHDASHPIDIEGDYDVEVDGNLTDTDAEAVARETLCETLRIDDLSGFRVEVA